MIIQLQYAFFGICLFINMVTIFHKFDKKIMFFIQLFQWVVCFAAMINFPQILLNIQPLYLLLTIPFAYALYLISLFIVGTKFTIKNLMLKFSRFPKSTNQFLFKEIVRTIASSLQEELIFRGIIQYTLFLMTNSRIAAIIIGVFCFSAIHYKKRIPLVKMLDIIIFSIIISISFQITLSVIFTVFLHILRNTAVIYQKYIFYDEERKRQLKDIYLKRKAEYKNEKNISG